ncbi:MAG: SGNH/GDSL hydrolase family protein [Thermoanaerobaculia bacterium]
MSERASGARRPGLALALAGLSALLALGAAEAFLRLASEHGLHVLDVEMWRYARLVKRPAAEPGLVEDHRPEADALLMGVRVRTDEHGFRRPDPATEARRRPEERVVAALGDSLTLGWGVPEGETWPARLERLLRERCSDGGATVLNAGIGNSNTAMQRARYARRVAPLRPDWVVLGWFINDAEPAPVPSRNPLLWRSALAGLLSTRFKQGAEVQLRDYRAYYGALYADDAPRWRAAREALRALGARLRRDRAAATLLLLPELHQPRAFGPFAKVYARVAAEGRAAGFEVLDPSGAFPPGPGARYWVSPTDAHPNTDAQRLFAEAAARSSFACGGGS